MNHLFEFLRKYYYLVLFLLLEVVSFVLLFRFNSYQGSVWFSSANAAVASVNRMYDEALAYLNLQSVNRVLTDENVRLQTELDALKETLRELTADTAYTERKMLENLADYELLPAKVVSNHRTAGNNYLVINRGEAEGVRPEMGVVGGSGVVGIVYLTGEHHALVLPIVNRKSSISCRLRGQNNFGYLRWEGQSRRRVFLDDIPRYAKVKEGDVVETSGYSAVFPPGLFVGRVRGIANSADGQGYCLDVLLGTDFSNIRDVNVVKTAYKSEMDALRNRVENLESGDSKN